MASRCWLALLLPGLVACAQGQDLDHPLHIGGQVKAPVLLQQVEADVSKVSEAERRKFHGVSVSLVVDADGSPERIQILDHSQSPEVDAAVVAAIRRYRFRPGTRDGVPVAVYVFVTANIDFL